MYIHILGAQSFTSMRADLHRDINDVDLFLTPPSPLSPILLNRLMEYRHLLADPPPPKWVTSLMDDPKYLLVYLEKNIRNGANFRRN